MPQQGGGAAGDTLAFLTVVLAYLSFISFSPAAAGDTLAPGASLSGGETLVSASSTFTFGFFTLNAVSLYAGVWYTDVTTGQIVVWVADRSNGPLSNTSSATIDFDNAGNLVVSDGSSPARVIAQGDGTTEVKAVLLDSGNLVLTQNSTTAATVLWQSFDSPGNTWLPGMKLPIVSWRSSGDPRPGDYSLSPDPNNTSETAILYRGRVQWAGELPLAAAASPDVLYTRFVIDSSGSAKQIVFSKSVNNWIFYRTAPPLSCMQSNQCGAFAVCEEEDGGGACRCPVAGFRQAGAGDSNSGSCVPVAPAVGCSPSDAFVPVPGVAVGSIEVNGLRVAAAGGDCAAACLANCGCTAYSVVSGAGCVLQSGSVYNMYRFLNASDSTSATVFLRVAAAAALPATSPAPALWAIGVAVPAAFAGALCTWCLWRSRAKRVNVQDTSGKKTLLGDGEGLSISTILESVRVQSNCRLFRRSDIAAATADFSPASLVGQGGFGRVYKGVLPDGQEVAVKLTVNVSLPDFENEVQLTAKLQHANLVRLLGCCVDGEERMLVYEFMPNRSLDMFLFDPAWSPLLDWRQRLRIVEGVAHGLNYLHRHCGMSVVHRDIKASNILLDGEMNPKISDFGTARALGAADRAAHRDTDMVAAGTHGYMAPEFAMKGVFSAKSDVFSFGVLLLEILAGERAARGGASEGARSLIGHALQLWESGEWRELLDPAVAGGEVVEEELRRCFRVAVLCVQQNAGDRPSMSEVISML